MGLNGSYIFTEMEVDYIQGTTRKSQLEGASPFIGNFDISYNVTNNEKMPLFRWSSSISVAGYTPLACWVSRISWGGVGTLDFVSSYRCKNHFTVKLKASNLLNPSYRLTRERSGSDKGEKVVLNDYKKE